MPSLLAERACAWYPANARDLPWRRPWSSPATDGEGRESGEVLGRQTGITAWGILISEVMLQQTPVSRVLPVWHEWVGRWPAPADLAAAPVGEAIRAWGRLGYPRRAMRLHECAVAIVRRHEGAVPSRLEDMLALPGIGDYTARAVLTFAFGQRHPVVDTNVRRLIARSVHGVEDKAVPLSSVAELLPHDKSAAARASVALMELGALVCTARSPRCTECPISSECAWRALGAPQPAQPFRRPQTYAGTDRQVRGLLLAVLREATGPVPQQELDRVWADAAQRERALVSLLSDGLIVSPGPGVFVLPA
jgi:A/G-specific adenine glycosylase